jgi:hypothetical protein
VQSPAAVALLQATRPLNDTLAGPGAVVHHAQHNTVLPRRAIGGAAAKRETAVDLLNLENAKQQWATFVSAPYIIVPSMILAAIVAWWVRSFKAATRISGLEGVIAGLRERIEVFEDRLKLAKEQAEAAQQARAAVEKQFAAYKAEISAHGEVAASLAAIAVKIEAALERLGTANNAVLRAAAGTFPIKGRSAVLGRSASPD